MFDRVELSKRMKDIVEQLKPLCAKVATILELELSASNQGTTQIVASDRPKTTSAIFETKLYGRDHQKKNIVDDITNKAKSSEENLTVFSIVGPGGVGKTTLTQHIYEEVKSHFHVPIWICVSLDFSADRLTKQIVEKIPKVDNENASSHEELIRKRLQSKQLLLVLDDMWTYHEDEWNKLLAPFKKVETKGNIVIVTTRIPKVANMVATTGYLKSLERLEEKDCMHFFEACVFGDQQPWEGDCADLHNVGIDIVKRLKGTPLAVKTVGRLLRNRLDSEYWKRVLESREWELQTNEGDIMPALRLSYNYLPFHLQHCFSYCALFPEDYEFGSEELIHLWIGLGLLGAPHQNKRTEDIGEDYLNDLVNYGFFQKKFRDDAHPYYLVHDLLHELVVNVSSNEFLSIQGSKLGTLQIPASIRHLSIIVDDVYVEDRMTFENYKSDLVMLGKRLKVDKLCSLMLFGRHHRSFLETFGLLLSEAKALRVIFLSGASYNVEDLLQNFSRLVHLRCLRIKGESYNQASIPSSTSRFYHLLVLDLKNCNYHVGCLREMSNLVKIRHLVNPDDDNFHSGVFEVGKLKSLQELPIFEVKKERSGFELKQLGKLLELHGSLEIRNLERVEEIEEAKLVHTDHIHKLILHWDTGRSKKDPENEQAVLENLKPHSSIRKICIKGHGGPTCPTWLGADLEIDNLEHLCLQDVAWESLPPLGKLWMLGEHGNEYPNHIPEQQRFQNLKSLELVNIQTLRRWCRNDASHFFDHLDILTVKGCSELVELPFQHYTGHEEAEQVKMVNLFPKLQKLDISDCPKLVSVPRIPWTPSLCKASIHKVGSGFESLSLLSKRGLIVSAEVKAQDSKLSDLLCFDNLSELEFLKIDRFPNLPLDQMHKLASLKNLTVNSCTNLLWPAEDDRKSQYQFPGVKRLTILYCNANGTELTQLVSYFPNLSALHLRFCKMVTGLGVAKKQTSETENETTGLGKNHAREEEGIEEIAQGLLLLPPQIESLTIDDCPDLSLYSCSLDDDIAVAGGLQSLRSLQSLSIFSCPKLLSSSSSSSSGSPFPASLQYLCLYDVKGLSTLDLPSNLTRFNAQNCGLRGAGIWRHLTQGQLKELSIFKTPKVLFGTEPAQMCEQNGSHRSQLQELVTDDITELPAMPISSSLASLKFWLNDNIECFTEEQEGAIKKLTSLQELAIEQCKKLQYLPGGLSGLPRLKVLVISDCPMVKSLPKDGLPSSLQELSILQCPAFRSLPKGSLPNSLVKLNVSGSGNEELRRQCRKLQGTIPIVRAAKTNPSRVFLH